MCVVANPGCGPDQGSTGLSSRTYSPGVVGRLTPVLFGPQGGVPSIEATQTDLPLVTLEKSDRV